MAISIPKKETILPYGTTSDNVVKLLDAIKNKQGDEKGIRAVYSGSKFDSTQSALETLNIISGLALTELGKQIVFEDDVEKKQTAYLRAVLSYSPYDYFLSFISQSESPVETEVETLKNFWGRNNYGTANNRSEGAPVCFTFFQLAGLGEYVIGRKGKSTRFVWRENYSDLIEQVKRNDALPQVKKAGAAEEEATSSSSDEANNGSDSIDEIHPRLGNSSFSNEKKMHSIVPANIEITVDMTEWDLDKIEKFLRLINGEELKRD